MLGLTQIFLILAIYTVIVFIFIWIETRRMRRNLDEKEIEMRRRLYEVTILRELGERIGYSLNVQKIVDVVTSSLRKLLEYSAVSYLILDDEGKLVFHAILEQSVSRQFISDIKKRLIDELKQVSDIDFDL